MAALVWLGLAVLAALAPHGAAQSTWTHVAQVPTTGQLTDVAYGNGLFVAVGQAGILLTSSDAANWTAQDLGTTARLSGITFGNGTFVASCTTTDVNNYLVVLFSTSTDGVHWTTNLPSTTVRGERLSGNVVFGGSFIAPLDSGNFLQSADGVHWTEQVQDQSAAQPGVAWVQGAYGGGRYLGILIGHQSLQSITATTVTSTDGLQWSMAANLPATIASLPVITFVNGLFVAMAQDTAGRGVVFTSSDGGQWTQQATGLAKTPAALTAGPGVVVGACSDGTVITSTDLQVWAVRGTGTDAILFGANFGGGQFAAVGDFGTIVTHDANAQLPLPTILSMAGASFTVDETAGTVEAPCTRSGDLSSAATFDLGRLLGMASFAAGAATGTVVIPIPYNPARNSAQLNADGYQELDLQLTDAPSDCALGSTGPISIILLDHEAPTRFAGLQDLNVSPNADGTGDFKGEIRIQNISGHGVGALRVRLLAGAIAGAGVPANFDRTPRELGIENPIATLADGAAIWQAYAGTAPAGLTGIGWNIYAALELKSGSDWVEIDRWCLFHWEIPTNGSVSSNHSVHSYGKAGPSSNGGALIVTTLAGGEVPFGPILITNATVSGPGTLLGGGRGRYAASATLKNGSALQVAPSWTTSLGTISSDGVLTVPLIGAPTTATVTATFKFDGTMAAVSRTILLQPLRAPVIVSALTAYATRGVGFRSQIMAVNHPAHFSTSALPRGLGLNQTTGLISGMAMDLGSFPITIGASNAAGSDSRTLTILVSDPSPLTVAVSGQGTLAASFAGLPGTVPLEIGTAYTIAATPAPGFLFAGWSGGIVSSARKLDFTMAENLSLQATFVPNPFMSAHGQYAGLVTDLPDSHGTSGALSLTLSGLGSFTARLVYGGVVHGARGSFSPGGTVTALPIRRSGVALLRLTLQLGVDGGGAPIVTGTLADVGATPLVSLARAIPAPGSTAGAYTLLFPVQTTSATLKTPLGTGFARLRLGASGLATWTGSLPDGSPISGSGALTGGNNLPVYSSLYGGRGSVVGLLNFQGKTASDCDGMLSWYRPANSSQIFRDAWRTSVTVAASGSRYSPASPLLPNLHAAGATGNASITLGSAPITHDLNIQPDQTDVLSPGSDRLGLQIDPATGLFHGTFYDTAAGRWRAFAGALSQRAGFGAGFHLDAAQSEKVSITPK